MTVAHFPLTARFEECNAAFVELRAEFVNHYLQSLRTGGPIFEPLWLIFWPQICRDNSYVRRAANALDGFRCLTYRVDSAQNCCACCVAGGRSQKISRGVRRCGISFTAGFSATGVLTTATDAVLSCSDRRSGTEQETIFRSGTSGSFSSVLSPVASPGFCPGETHSEPRQPTD